MSTDTLLEKRVAALEKAVQELQQKATLPAHTPGWLYQMIGSFKDQPAFNEVVSYGKAIREADANGENGESK